MKSLIFCFLFGVFSITFSFSQVEFKRGDLVHENGESQRVFIRYTDQYETPSSFEYKINIDDNHVHLATPENFQKVIIDDAYYFEKHHVKIDVSRQKNISINREPNWEEQSIFLQKIVDSKASLFRYTVGSLNYYFYQKEPTSVPVLLVYKDYVVDGKKMTNQHYKQQLINEFQCESIPLHTVQNLSYTESALQSFFIKYNECLGFLVKQIDYHSPSFFNLKIAPRVIFSKANSSIKFMTHRVYEAYFGNKIAVSLGTELEYVLSLNRNKWAVFIEPNYHYFEAESVYTINNREEKATIEYASIELPIGLRYYWWLNPSSKLFVNAGYIVDFSLKAQFEMENYRKVDDGSSGPSGFLGLGYNYNNKYDVEFRYALTRNLTNNWENNSAEYDYFALIVRYNFL